MLSSDWILRGDVIFRISIAIAINALLFSIILNFVLYNVFSVIITTLYKQIYKFIEKIKLCTIIYCFFNVK